MFWVQRNQSQITSQTFNHHSSPVSSHVLRTIPSYRNHRVFENGGVFNKDVVFTPSSSIKKITHFPDDATETNPSQQTSRTIESDNSAACHKKSISELRCGLRVSFTPPPLCKNIYFVLRLVSWRLRHSWPQKKCHQKWFIVDVKTQTRTVCGGNISLCSANHDTRKFASLSGDLSADVIRTCGGKIIKMILMTKCKFSKLFF